MIRDRVTPNAPRRFEWSGFHRIRFDRIRFVRIGFVWIGFKWIRFHRICLHWIGLGSLGGVAGLALACSGGIAVLGSDADTFYHNEERGYRIPHPRAAGNAWHRASVDGADLTFRRPNADGEATLSLLSRCQVGSAEPIILARHLVIGIPDRNLRQAGPAFVDGLPAWTQTFDIGDSAEASTVRVKTVTARSGDCVYDFVLTCRGSFLATERQFDSWWRSFELEAADEPVVEEVAR